MPSTKPWSILRERMNLTPEQEAELEASVAEMRAETNRYQRMLWQMRKARELTRPKVAQQLGVTEVEVCELEPRADRYLATLDHRVHDLGGELKLIAVFGGEEF